jgi:hypothetical protein
MRVPKREAAQRKSPIQNIWTDTRLQHVSSRKNQELLRLLIGTNPLSIG